MSNIKYQISKAVWCYLLFIICYWGTVVVHAQNIDQTYIFAAEQYQNKNFATAINAYQRVVFFGGQTNRDNSLAYYQLANCYFELKNFEKAAGYYDLAFFSLKNDSVKTEIAFKKISCLLLNHQFQYAQVELLGLDDSMSVYFQRKKNFYFGITYFGLNQFDSAETCFLRVIDEKDVVAKEKIKNIFIRNKQVDKIHPKTAKVLSIIIPGLGQFYSGDIRNGINSFLITSIFLAIGINTAIVYSPIDAIASVIPWYQRYFMGGYQKAETIAIKKIARKRAVLYQEILGTVALK